MENSKRGASPEQNPRPTITRAELRRKNRNVVVSLTSVILALVLYACLRDFLPNWCIYVLAGAMFFIFFEVIPYNLVGTFRRPQVSESADDAEPKK